MNLTENFRRMQSDREMREARGLDWLAAEWHDCADRREIERQRQHAADLGYSSLETMIACGEPLLHSTVTETIGAAGDSPDRTSISAFESNIPANPTESYVGECISTAYDHQSSTVTFNVSNPNNHELKITVRSGNRITDDSNWPTAVDSAEEQQSYYSGAIAVETNDVTIEYLEFSDTSFNYAVRADNASCTRLTMRYMVCHGDNVADVRIIRGNNDAASLTGAETVTCHNVLGYYLRRCFWMLDHHFEVFNCAVALELGSSSKGYLAQQTANVTTYDPAIVKNCVSAGYDADFQQNAAGDIDATNSDYLLSSDTTASSFAATTSWTSVAASTFFTDVTAPGLDFTPAVQTTYAGDSGNGFTDDIAGTARSEYTIGPIEYPAPPGGVTVPQGLSEIGVGYDTLGQVTLEGI